MIFEDNSLGYIFIEVLKHKICMSHIFYSNATYALLVSKAIYIFSTKQTILR
jgi:hypothetical protein